MAFVYDINNPKKDKRSRNCLFVCHTISCILTLFTTTFLSAHIYSFDTNIYNYIFNVGIYNLVLYATMGVFYILLASLVDRTKRIGFYQFSLILKVALVILFIFCGKQLAKLLVLAGFICGLSDAFYYSSYNVLKEEMVSRKSVGGFTTLLYTMSKLIDVVFPITLGALVDSSSFELTSIIVLVFCIVQVGTSFGIKSQKPQDSHFSLREYRQKLNEHPEAKRRVKLIYAISMIYGSSTLTSILLGICIMFKFHSTFSFGMLTSIFAVFSAISLLLINKFTKPGKRMWLFIVFATIMLGCGIMMTFTISKYSVIIFNAIFAISAIVYKCVFDIHRNGILKESGLYSEISEHHTVVEVLISICRTIGFALTIAISFTKSLLLFQIFLFISCSLIATMFILLLVYEKKFITPNIKKKEEKIEIKND